MNSVRLFVPVSLLRQSLQRRLPPFQVSAARSFNSKLAEYLPLSDTSSSYYRNSSKREARYIDLPRNVFYLAILGVFSYCVVQFKKFYRRPLFDGQSRAEKCLSFLEGILFRWVLNAFCFHKHNEILHMYKSFQEKEHKYAAPEYLPLKAIADQFMGITNFRLQNFEEAERYLQSSMGFFKDCEFSENDLAVILNTLFLSLVTLHKGDYETAYKGLLFCTSSMLRFRSVWRNMEESELVRYGFVALSCYAHFIRHATAHREKFVGVDWEFLDDVLNEAQSLAHVCAHNFKRFHFIAPDLQSDLEALYIMILNDILHQKLTSCNYEETWVSKMLNEMKEVRRALDPRVSESYKEEALMFGTVYWTFRGQNGGAEKAFSELKLIYESSNDPIVKNRALDQLFDIWFRYQKNI